MKLAAHFSVCRSWTGFLSNFAISLDMQPTTAFSELMWWTIIIGSEEQSGMVVTHNNH